MNGRIKAVLVAVAVACSGLLMTTRVTGQNLYAAVDDEAYYPEGVIMQIRPAGTETVFSPPGFAGNALFTGQVLGIAFNSAGELFACAYTNILEISTNGSVSIFANGFTTNNPYSLAFNGSGTLFAGVLNEYANGIGANTNFGYIIRFNSDGTRTTFASGLFEPVGLAFDNAGNLFVADEYSDSIFKFTPAGVKSTFAAYPAATLDFPEGLVFNSAGNLFEADFETGHIYEFTTNGVQSTFISGLNYPIGLAFNSAGDLFVTQDGGGYYNHIIEITPAGVTNSFGPEVLDPWGLAFAPTAPNLRATCLAGTFRLTVSMPSPYYSTVIQASTNLVNWVNVYTNAPSFVFTDSIISNPSCRFYRAALAQ